MVPRHSPPVLRSSNSDPIHFHKAYSPNKIIYLLRNRKLALPHRSYHSRPSPSLRGGYTPCCWVRGSFAAAAQLRHPSQSLPESVKQSAAPSWGLPWWRVTPGLSYRRTLGFSQGTWYLSESSLPIIITLLWYFIKNISNNSITKPVQYKILQVVKKHHVLLWFTKIICYQQLRYSHFQIWFKTSHPDSESFGLERFPAIIQVLNQTL